MTVDWIGNKVSKKSENVETFVVKSQLNITLWKVLRVIGLLPITVKKCALKKKKTSWVISYSTFWYIYSWIILIFLVAANSAAVDFVFKRLVSSYKAPKKLRVLYILQLCLFFLTLIFAIGRSSRHTRSLIRARNLSRKASSLLLWCEENKIDRNRIRLFPLLILTFSIIQITYEIFYIWKNILLDHLLSVMVGISLSLFQLTYGLSCSVIVQFTEELNPLQKVFSQINFTLKTILADLTTCNSKKTVGDFRNKLSTALEARQIIGKSCRIVAKHQSPNILLIMISITVRSIAYTYLAISNGGRITIIRSILSIICEVGKLISIVETCQTIMDASDKTNKFLVKLLKHIHDRELRADLKFCLRYAQNNPVKFTGMDVLIIDREVIALVFGTVLTNVLVTVQLSG